MQINEIYHKGKTYYLFKELDWSGRLETEWLLTSVEYKNAQNRAKKFFKTVPIKDYEYVR